VTGTAGQLLVAEPMLGDPNFDRTVVLIVDHTPEGALGLVLNRPTDLLVAEALPAWAALVSDPPVLHVGGPVEGRSGWCVAHVTDATTREGFVPVVGDVGLLDLDTDPAEVAGAVLAARLFAGYSGWGAGQLEAELAADAWYVVAAAPDDPFLPDAAALWSRILARQGGPLARLANFPPDPSLN
jgi:putative transcriptional regulator